MKILKTSKHSIPTDRSSLSAAIIKHKISNSFVLLVLALLAYALNACACVANEDNHVFYAYVKTSLNIVSWFASEDGYWKGGQFKFHIVVPDEYNMKVSK